MSIFETHTKPLAKATIDKVFVIYGKPGTGKTVLASSFPHTKEKPMLYLDILEGGTASIPPIYQDNIILMEMSQFEQVDEVLTSVYEGFFTDSAGKKQPLAYSTIVIDSATQLEYLIKEYLKKQEKKDRMNIGLWGQLRESHDTIWNMAKMLHIKTGAYVVIVCHEKEYTNDKDPSLNTIIPNLMTAPSYNLCAKASYVWYTRLEYAQYLDKKTNELRSKTTFQTQIAEDPALLTKCRRPMGMHVPPSIRNLNFDMFKRNILDVIEGRTPPTAVTTSKDEDIPDADTEAEVPKTAAGTLSSPSTPKVSTTGAKGAIKSGTETAPATANKLG